MKIPVDAYGFVSSPMDITEEQKREAWRMWVEEIKAVDRESRTRQIPRSRIIKSGYKEI